MQVSAVSEREAARSFETLIQHGLSERAVVRYRASLSSFFTWCVREKIIVRNPVTGTKVPRSSDEPTEMRPWTDRAALERLNDPYRGPTAAPVRQHNGRGYVGASPRAVLANITRCQSRDARGRDGKNPQVRATCGFFVVLVELRGFEPLTFSLRTRRATNCATAPCASRRDAKIHERSAAHPIGPNRLRRRWRAGSRGRSPRPRGRSARTARRSGRGRSPRRCGRWTTRRWSRGRWWRPYAVQPPAC
jgi:hypothetical protein